MITLKIVKPDGTKELAHFQNLDKCAKWINLYYHKFSEITMTQSKTKESYIFKSKLDFELFYEKNKK